MADDDTERDDLKRAIEILSTLVGIGYVLWIVWDYKKDDPLAFPQQVKRWWENRQRERVRRERDRRELANWALDLALFLERKVEEWAKG